MDKAIGGYFELETGTGCGDYPHPGAFHLNSGRHAFEFILRSQDRLPEAVWLPYYTCDSVFQPLRRLGIPFRFYHINPQLELQQTVNLSPGEMIVVNDYFGLKDRYVQSLHTHYREQLVIDCTQAWYMRSLPGARQFYSPRKFFGLPDGGVASTPVRRELQLEQDHSADRCGHLLKRIDMDSAAGYQDFRNTSAVIAGLPLLRLSGLTERLLGSIRHEDARRIRLSNYAALHNALAESNQFESPAPAEFASGGCPMIYPFVSSDRGLRRRLIDNKIYVATYWPGIESWTPAESFETELSRTLIPLPVDQRYGQEDMKRIIDVIYG